MALTQISTDGIKNGTITGADLATNIDLVDNQKLRFGTGNDLEIYHTGSGSVINDAGTGSLHLRVGGSNRINVESNGVALFYNGNRKLETLINGVKILDDLVTEGTVSFNSTSDNVNFAGANYNAVWIPASNRFRWNDNAQATFGTGSDLQIYHNGTTNIIAGASTASDINIEAFTGAGVNLISNGNHYAVKCISNAQVELYYDNSKKLETVSGGATITGTGFCTGALIVGSGSDFQVTRDSGNTEVQNYNGTLLFGNASSNANNVFIRGRADENSIVCIPDGAVELYYDNVKKLRTQSGGVTFEGTDSGGNVSHGRFYYKVESGTVKALYDPNGGKFQLYDSVHASFGNSHDLQIYHNGSHSYIENSTGTLVIRNTHAGTVKIQGVTGEQSIVATANGSVDLYYDNSKKFETQTNGITVTGGVYSDGLICGDSEMVELGNSGDLQIYHDGTSNIFLANSGDLNIRMNNSENAIVARQNGAAELYHNNVKKFETESGGARLTGRLNMQVNSNTTYPTSFGTNAYVPFAHELVIDNNVGGTQGSFAGIFFNAGADTDGSKVGTARISAVETGNYKADLVFATRSTGFSEKARITHNGVLMIGATSTLSNETRLTVRNDTEAKVSTFHHNHNSQRSCIDCQNDYAAGSNSAIMIEFRRDNGTSVGGIFASTSNVSYNTASDYRLKENQVAISDGITRLKELKPYKFNFKENKDKIVDGFFAHEVSSVVPEAITGIKDEVDENNDPVYQGIDQSKLVPLLVASLQEAIGKIEVLETEVAALKAA